LIDHAAKFLLSQPGTARGERRRVKRDPIPAFDRQEYQPPIPTEPQAVREALLAVCGGAAEPLPEALRIETAAFLRVTGTEESKAKIAAFFAARKKG
jgi:hypothetical protein